MSKISDIQLLNKARMEINGLSKDWIKIFIVVRCSWCGIKKDHGSICPFCGRLK